MSNDEHVYRLRWPPSLDLRAMDDPVKVECQGQVAIFERAFWEELSSDPEWVRHNPDARLLP